MENTETGKWIEALWKKEFVIDKYEKMNKLDWFEERERQDKMKKTEFERSKLEEEGMHWGKVYENQETLKKRGKY